MAFVDHETITGRDLIEEIQRYLTVVDAFRGEGVYPTWASEGDPIGGKAEWPSNDGARSRQPFSGPGTEETGR